MAEYERLNLHCSSGPASEEAAWRHCNGRRCRCFCSKCPHCVAGAPAAGPAAPLRHPTTSHGTLSIQAAHRSCVPALLSLIWLSYARLFISPTGGSRRNQGTPYSRGSCEEACRDSSRSGSQRARRRVRRRRRGPERRTELSSRRRRRCSRLWQGKPWRCCRRCCCHA